MDVNECQLTLIDEKTRYIVLVLDVLVLGFHHAHYHLLHLTHVSLTAMRGWRDRVCGVCDMYGICNRYSMRLSVL